MPYGKEIAIMVGAAGAGVLQTLAIQKFVEPTQGNWVPQLGGFGKPAALIGIVTGVGAIALGYLSMTRRITPVGILNDPRIQFALLGYGGSSLVSGLAAGYLGTSTTSRAFPRTASVRAAPSGYSMISKKETNIL